MAYVIAGIDALKEREEPPVQPWRPERPSSPFDWLDELAGDQPPGF